MLCIWAIGRPRSSSVTLDRGFPPPCGFLPVGQLLANTQVCLFPAQPSVRRGPHRCSWSAPERPAACCKRTGRQSERHAGPHLEWVPIQQLGGRREQGAAGPGHGRAGHSSLPSLAPGPAPSDAGQSRDRAIQHHWHYSPGLGLGGDGGHPQRFLDSGLRPLHPYAGGRRGPAADHQRLARIRAGPGRDAGSGGGHHPGRRWLRGRRVGRRPADPGRGGRLLSGHGAHPSLCTARAAPAARAGQVALSWRSVLRGAGPPGAAAPGAPLGRLARRLAGLGRHSLVGLRAGGPGGLPPCPGPILRGRRYRPDRILGRPAVVSAANSPPAARGLRVGAPHLGGRGLHGDCRGRGGAAPKAHSGGGQEVMRPLLPRWSRCNPLSIPLALSRWSTDCSRAVNAHSNKIAQGESCQLWSQDLRLQDPRSQMSSQVRWSAASCG
uniref:Uncharacterized protein n=1 Tax=Auxenochlorella protothecoides TaxID=3075 RepID=A0A1D1ZVN7_AUXPR